MLKHAREYGPKWREPTPVYGIFEFGRLTLTEPGADMGVRAWRDYMQRAIDKWPFPKAELREFRTLFLRGDFPMLLKGDPEAAPELNAPVFTNANNGQFYEVLMPVSWRPQFNGNFSARRREGLQLAAQHPWSKRKDVAVWRGSIGCATGCGPRGKAYFPDSALDSCSDDMAAGVSDWKADEIGATWGCGDVASGERTKAFLKHPRMQLVSRLYEENCGTDVGFHSWGRHGAFVRARVQGPVMNAWQKSEMTDDETASNRYVFLVGNNGYSDRSWRMFALGSTVLMVDNGWKEFYFDLIKPWEHYIPVKADASDACEQLKWARDHPERAEEIANAGRNFVEKCMTESFIDLYVAEMIRQLGELWALGKERTRLARRTRGVSMRRKA